MRPSERLFVTPVVEIVRGIRPPHCGRHFLFLFFLVLHNQGKTPGFSLPYLELNLSGGEEWESNSSRSKSTHKLEYYLCNKF